MQPMENPNSFEFEVAASDAGERLDKLVLAALSDLTRAQVQTLIKEGRVTVDGRPIKAGVKLRGGEQIRIALLSDETTEEADAIAPEAIDLKILYEDDDLVVLEKPAGLTVHPGVGNEQGTLANALLARYPELAEMQGAPEAEGRMGIVHRLDKDTSGLMVAARNLETLRALMNQFRERSVEKQYIALLERRPKTERGVIDAPIARDPRQRKRMAVVQGGRPAVTDFEIIDDNFLEDRALVRLTLHTGRTHQIRVHMAFIGCPVVGDRVYGFRKQRLSLKRQFLHAALLAFTHPRSEERLKFESPLPPSLQNILDKLRR